MYQYTCPNCGAQNILPNVLKCPYCNRDLSGKTDELSKKHIAKCSYYLNPYKYSNRGPGRPRKDEYPVPD